MPIGKVSLGHNLWWYFFATYHFKRIFLKSSICYLLKCILRVVTFFWARHRQFRILHLIAIVIVIVQSWVGVNCRLTSWKMLLREKAGAALYSGSFIQYWLHKLLFLVGTGMGLYYFVHKLCRLGIVKLVLDSPEPAFKLAKRWFISTPDEAVVASQSLRYEGILL